MQEDNKGLMPELKTLYDYLTNMINMAAGVADDQYLAGMREGFIRAREGIKDSFNWSHRGGISAYVNSLDYDQLCRLLEVANEIKARKDEEEKLVVHRVIYWPEGGKDFRQEHLQEALTHYHEAQLRVAAEKPGDLRALKEVELRHVRVRASEYEEYFS